MAVDTKRMYLLTADVGELLDLTRQVWRDRLLDLCYTVSPALVIIDSLNAVTSTGTKSVEDVNALMSFLAGVGATSTRRWYWSTICANPVAGS